MDSEQFSRQIEAAYKEALKGADAITANAQAIREQAQQELDAARDARKSAENAGEKMAQEFFEKACERQIESTKTELLRSLAVKHLEAGKAVEEIALWLDVDCDFVEDVRSNRQRAARVRTTDQRAPVPVGNPRVRYESSGRSGTVYFESDEASFSMWWEFAGGGALAIIDVPTAEDWTARTKLPSASRTSILTFIGEQVVQDQAGGRGSYEIGENDLTIYSA